jgi:hypothetical protein
VACVTCVTSRVSRALLRRVHFASASSTCQDPSHTNLVPADEQVLSFPLPLALYIWHEESVAMFPYKFAPHSQKKDTNLAGTAFGGSLKRSNLDVTPNGTITESTTKRVFDGRFSHSLSSRHVESHTLSGSAYPHRTPEVVDSKPPIPATVSPYIAHFSTSRAYLNGLSVSEHLLHSALSQ